MVSSMSAGMGQPAPTGQPTRGALEPHPDKLKAFVGRMLGDLGAAMSATLVLIGDQLGLYKALDAHGPSTPEELARHTSTSERYIREWLNNQAASGYVDFNPATRRYALNPEQAAVFADESSPVFMGGAFQITNAMAHAQEQMAENFRTGGGLDWRAQHPNLFVGTERFFRPGYRAHLVSEWIPALEGVEAKLRRGAAIADIGCGMGASTILMAQAFPNSRIWGFDFHEVAVETARNRARQAGVSNVWFERAGAEEFPGNGYDLACCFDCLHDMGDPVGAARHVHEALAADGTWMVVEPMAGGDVSENLNPVGRCFYAASTMICVPASLAQQGVALGAQAGEACMSDVIRQGGFGRVRRAAQTPFNLVLEARP